jgi:hypothetical protein
MITNFRTLPVIHHRVKPSTNAPGDAGSVDQCPETIAYALHDARSSELVTHAACCAHDGHGEEVVGARM